MDIRKTLTDQTGTLKEALRPARLERPPECRVPFLMSSAQSGSLFNYQRRTMPETKSIDWGCRREADRPCSLSHRLVGQIFFSLADNFSRILKSHNITLPISPIKTSRLSSSRVKTERTEMIDECGGLREGDPCKRGLDQTGPFVSIQRQTIQTDTQQIPSELE